MLVLSDVNEDNIIIDDLWKKPIDTYNNMCYTLRGSKK